ncbi:MAG: efflux RND transporter periplasmic adaptor subunit [Elainella sp.]
MLLSAVLLTGCNAVPKGEAQPTGRGGDPNAPAAVESAVAAPGVLEAAIEYTGTTIPVREVSLRAQTEGRLLELGADVGDRVNQGQVLGQVDSRLLLALVGQERAELAALESEVAQAEAEVSDARAQVEQARVALAQAQSDAQRLQSLASQGAITEQAAEQAVTGSRTAAQVLRSAQEQVRTRQQGVAAAQRRVAAQQATLVEVEAREAFAQLTAPISGAVLQKASEPGDLVQPGDEVLTLGDFSAVKVRVQVSELELGNLRVGQAAQVRLDAFPNRSFQGQITRISPAAEPTARLIPLEVTIPNPNRQIGSGLLARVQFEAGQTGQRVIVPESALQKGNDASQVSLFVLQGSGETATVSERRVTLGRMLNNQVEIQSGLRAGEAFVIRSSRPLKNGESVQLSILSETGQSGSASPQPAQGNPPSSPAPSP